MARHHLLGLVIFTVVPGITLAQDDDGFGEEEYRYNFSERKVEAGLDVGSAVLLGTSTKSFLSGATVTPYMDFSFGDGNSLDFQVTLGYHPFDEDNAQYYFFRSPVVDGTTAEGELVYAIPQLTFRYESDLTSSLASRGRVFYWAGIGAGPAFVSSAAKLENAGTLGTVEYEHADTTETFLTIVPAAGLRFRLGEFFFLNLGARLDWLVQFGQPEVAQEGDLPGFKIVEGTVGISYEIGG